ncbi:MAG: amino acid ABC transporter ATP-binding protein [Candidatus Heimdallarchaeota archaeon]|nr:amino acid ABC transporter ATP-binding protein [Candidatus Heimdallarchaeota archaeon]
MRKDTGTLLEVKDLHKTFSGDVKAVQGVDFEVRNQEVVVIVGASGSGKSTVLRCINRLEQPTQGIITFDGEDITETADINKIRSEIGFVFQSFELFPHLTVLRNVTLALELVRNLKPSEADAKAREVLTDLDLSDKLDSYPGQLSGGQKQRVAIARALAMNPKLILFDEPTSALDPELVGYVLDTLRMLANKGMTMVVVTHQIRFAAEVADWAVYMTEGKIVEQGNAKEMLSNPKEERTKQFLASTLKR